MKRFLVLIIPVLFLAGCEAEYIADDDYDTYVDNDTCVEYFVNTKYYTRGIISPKYNGDGTLKLNETCLKNKEDQNATK